MKLAIAFALLMCVAAPVMAQTGERTLFKITLVSAMAAHGADLASTENCLGAGRCRELNPALLRFTSPAWFGAGKMGMAAGSLWLTAKLAESHPKLATTLNVLQTVTFSALAAHNARVSR